MTEAFLVRTEPASSMVKPAHIHITSAPHTRNEKLFRTNWVSSPTAARESAGKSTRNAATARPTEAARPPRSPLQRRKSNRSRPNGVDTRLSPGSFPIRPALSDTMFHVLSFEWALRARPSTHSRKVTQTESKVFGMHFLFRILQTLIGLLHARNVP